MLHGVHVDAFLEYILVVVEVCLQRRQQQQDGARLPQSVLVVGVVHVTIVMPLLSCNATAAQNVSMALMSVDVK